MEKSKIEIKTVDELLVLCRSESVKMNKQREKCHVHACRGCDSGDGDRPPYRRKD